MQDVVSVYSGLSVLWARVAKYVYVISFVEGSGWLERVNTILKQA